jgi:Zn-finger nucleic acid-binding protein
MRFPVWTFDCENEGAPGRDETWLTPVPPESLPVAEDFGGVIATDLTLANGQRVFGTLYRLSPLDLALTRAFLILTVFQGERTRGFSHYPMALERDEDAAQDLSDFLGLPVSSVFPISYDVSALVRGLDEVVRGSVLATAAPLRRVLPMGRGSREHRAAEAELSEVEALVRDEPLAREEEAERRRRGDSDDSEPNHPLLRRLQQARGRLRQTLTRSFPCPLCGAELPYEDLGTRPCRRCRKIWLPRQAIEIYFRTAGEVSWRHARGTELVCPTCPFGSSLLTVRWPTPSSEVKVCSTCRGVWLDQDRLEEVRARRRGR